MFSTYTSTPSYDKLVEAIKIYLNRFDEDTLAAIPFFINAAEKTILRNLRMPSMEKIVTFTLEDYSDAPEERWASLPYDYLEMKHIWTKCDIDDQVIVKRVSFENMLRSLAQEKSDQEPMWSTNADRLYLSGIPLDQEIFMTYYADVPELHPETQSNVLLDLAPDAFLYMSVGEGFRFIMEEDKSEYWENQGFERLRQIMEQVKEAEYSGSAFEIIDKVNKSYDGYDYI